MTIDKEEIIEWCEVRFYDCAMANIDKDFSALKIK